MANRITTGSIHVLARVICIPLMILIGIIQAVGTVLTAMSAVILKTISVVMLFITLLLLLFGLLPWMKVLVIILIAVSMFWIPEGLGLIVLGLTAVQVKLRDIMDWR